MQIRFKILSAALLAGFVLSPAALAQSSELSILAGATNPSASVDLGSGGSISAGVSASVQLSYAYRLRETPTGSLYVELPAARVFKASVGVRPGRITAGQNQFFFTPGLKYQFAPQARVSPYAVGGFGFGRFDDVNVQWNGPVSVEVATGFKPAAAFGAGADLRITHGFAFRVEVRDFVTCAAHVSQRNQVVFNGGFAFRF